MVMATTTTCSSRTPRATGPPPSPGQEQGTPGALALVPWAGGAEATAQPPGSQALGARLQGSLASLPRAGPCVPPRSALHSRPLLAAGQLGQNSIQT